MRQNDTFHIVYISDNNYLFTTFVAVKSMIECLQMDDRHRYVIHICTMDVDKSLFDYFLNFEKKGISIEINSFDKHGFDEKTKNVLVKTHVSATALMKFELPNFFSDIDKMLYLDSDTMIIGDISPIFSYNIDNYLMGVVCERVGMMGYIDKFVEYPFGFNSGVMFMNLKKMRDENTVSALWNYKFSNISGKFMDQEAFNQVCKNKVLFLPYEWNVITVDLKEEAITEINILYDRCYSSVQDVLKDARILHYAGKKEKPWDYSNVPEHERWMAIYNSLDGMPKLKLKNYTRLNALTDRISYYLKYVGFSALVSAGVGFIKRLFPGKKRKEKRLQILKKLKKEMENEA